MIYHESFIYHNSLKISEGLVFHIPTVGEIIEYGERNYYNSAFILSAMPYDLMVQLHDAGIDFTTINDYDLFLSLFPHQSDDAFSLFLPGIVPSEFIYRRSTVTDEIELYNPKTDVVINRVAQGIIADLVRDINYFEKHINKPANRDAYEYMIKKARKRLKRAERNKNKLQLEQLILAMVNTPEFKYNFETVRNLTIYAFNASVRQIVSRINYDHVMNGVYAGTVDYEKINKDSLDWINGKGV